MASYDDQTRGVRLYLGIDIAEFGEWEGGLVKQNVARDDDAVCG
jgi:hypothetical protein